MTDPADNPEVIDVWGYIRLSQDGRDDSLEGQREAIRAYCARRDRLNLVTIVSDGETTSGFDRDRPRFQTLVDRVADGSINGVVVRDRKRLARGWDIRHELVGLFREHGAEFHVTEERGRVGLEDVTNAAMDLMRAAIDHETKMTEINRAREVVAERLANDEWQGGIPYGLQLDENGQYLAKDEDEWDTVMEILTRYDDGGSYRGVARELEVTRHKVESVIKNRERYEAADKGVPIGNPGALYELSEHAAPTEQNHHS